MKQIKSQKIQTMALFAILAAIVVVMSITPLGYLKIGLLEISFLTIPVTIGAVLLGPASGAALGFVFGITSFIQCFGMSAFGATLLGINPFYTFILCIVPRVLMGLLTGLIFKWIAKVDKTKIVSYAVASMSGAILNTVLFMSLFVLCFYNTEFVQGTVTALGTTNVFAFAAAFVGSNAFFEAIVAFLVSFPVTKAVARYSKRFS